MKNLEQFDVKPLSNSELSLLNGGLLIEIFVAIGLTIAGWAHLKNKNEKFNGGQGGSGGSSSEQRPNML